MALRNLLVRPSESSEPLLENAGVSTRVSTAFELHRPFRVRVRRRSAFIGSRSRSAVGPCPGYAVFRATGCAGTV